MQSIKPDARREGLVVRELPDEVLVYDRDRDRAHCLDRTAALVWKSCDGVTTVPEIAAVLRRELQIPASEEFVWLALDRLSRIHLLRERLRPPALPADVSRRQLVRKMALVGALSITSIVAPVAAQAGSSRCVAVTNGSNCTAAQCGHLCASCKGGNFCTKFNGKGSIICHGKTIVC